MRMQDKLNHNDNHYPLESFKIAYIIARLGGEASQHVSIRRRYRSYSTVNELLDHLVDLYEVPLLIIKDTNWRAFEKITQGNQSFLDFYRVFMKFASRYAFEANLIRHLARKSELRSIDQDDILNTYIMKTKLQLKTYIMMR